MQQIPNNSARKTLACETGGRKGEGTSGGRQSPARVRANHTTLALPSLNFDLKIDARATFKLNLTSYLPFKVYIFLKQWPILSVRTVAIVFSVATFPVSAYYFSLVIWHICMTCNGCWDLIHRLAKSVCQCISEQCAGILTDLFERR